MFLSTNFMSTHCQVVAKDIVTLRKKSVRYRHKSNTIFFNILSAANSNQISAPALLLKLIYVTMFFILNSCKINSMGKK